MSIKTWLGFRFFFGVADSQQAAAALATEPSVAVDAAAHVGPAGPPGWQGHAVPEKPRSMPPDASFRTMSMPCRPIPGLIEQPAIRQIASLMAECDDGFLATESGDEVQSVSALSGNAPAHSSRATSSAWDRFAILVRPILLYVHRNAVLGRGFDRLRVGDRVRAVLGEAEGEHGPQATAVILL